MAKKSIRRRKARKPKLIDIRGHQMTEAMYEDYTQCVDARYRTNKGETGERIATLGLGDFLSDYRPSTKIKRQLLDFTKEAMDVSLAIGTMRDYSWYSSSSDTIREAGVELVKKLALDLHYASAKLTAIVSNLESEGTTKLQDWLAQDEALKQIGKGGEVAHG